MARDEIFGPRRAAGSSGPVNLHGYDTLRTLDSGKAGKKRQEERRSRPRQIRLVAT